MISALCLLLLCVIVLWAYAAWGHDFGKLGRFYLAGLPFCPLTALLNHNLDGRSMLDYFGPDDLRGPVLVMLPVYLIALFGFLSYARSRRPEPTARKAILWPLGLIVAYGVFCFANVPWAMDSAWSFSALLWTIPIFAFAYLAGTATKPSDIDRERWFFLAAIGLVLVNMGLVVYGIRTGRAESLNETRNFGSVFASNSLMALLVLMGGLAFMQSRRNWLPTALLGTACLMGAILSLSRTALFLLALLLFLVLWASFRREGKPVGQAILVCLAGLVVLGVALSDTIARFNLGTVWLGRFFDPDSTNLRFGGALEVRGDIFAADREALLANPFEPRGYGMYFLTAPSGFTDSHHLTFTELYENGALAWAMMATLFVAAMIIGIRSKHRGEMAPLLLSLGLWLVLAHTTGSTLAIRTPGGYTTPVYGAMALFLIGMLVARATADPDPSPVPQPVPQPEPLPRLAEAGPA